MTRKRYNGQADTFGLTLSEIMLILVFGLLIVVAVVWQRNASLTNASSNQESQLEELEKKLAQAQRGGNNATVGSLREQRNEWEAKIKRLKNELEQAKGRKDKEAKLFNKLVKEARDSGLPPMTSDGPVEALWEALRGWHDDRGRVASLEREKERLEREIKNLRDQGGKAAGGAPDGLTDPPCWADTGGKPQFVFHVELLENGFHLSRDWPEERTAEVARITGWNDPASYLGNRGRRLSTAEFHRIGSAFYDDGDNRERKCRYFVRVEHGLQNIATFIRQIKAVENYFYKLQLF